MERYKKSDDRNQLSIMPMSLDEMIPADVKNGGLYSDEGDYRVPNLAVPDEYIGI